MKYYIKSGAKIYGPAEENKIAEKIASGFFSNQCFVSTDRVNWTQINNSETVPLEATYVSNSADDDVSQDDSNLVNNQSQTSYAQPSDNNGQKQSRNLDNDSHRSSLKRFFNLKVAIIFASCFLFILACTTFFVLSGPNAKMKKKISKAKSGPKTKSFQDVCKYYQEAVGVVVVTLEDSNGKLLDSFMDIPVDCYQPIGTAFDISDNQFVTNCHVAYGIKDTKTGLLDDILLRVVIR